MSVTSLSSSEFAVDYVNSKGRLIERSLGLSEKKYDNTFSVRIYKDVIIETQYIEKLPSLSIKLSKALSGFLIKMSIYSSVTPPQFVALCITDFVF